MELWNAPLFFMNILKIKNQKCGGTLALFEKDSYLSVSQSVSEKAKLIRGDPPKIDFKKKGEPPKKWKNPLNSLCPKPFSWFCYKESAQLLNNNNKVAQASP